MAKTRLTHHVTACHRKKRFPTKYVALNAMHNLERQSRYDGESLRVYECTECDGWHVGHKRTRKERR